MVVLRFDSAGSSLTEPSGISASSIMKAHTTFVGDANDAEEFRAEWSELTGEQVKAEHLPDGSWMMSVDVPQEKADDLNMREDWIVVAPSNQEVFDGGEFISKEYSRRVRDIEHWLYTIEHKNERYVVEVQTDGNGLEDPAFGSHTALPIRPTELTPAPNPQMERVLTIGDLRKALEQFDDNDQVVVEIHEGVRHEDLYTFYVDHMDGLRDVEGNEFNEVRLCI